MAGTRAQDHSLGSIDEIRTTLRDVAENEDGDLIGSISERVIDRQLVGARVHADSVESQASKAELRELVIAKAALGVAGSDRLVKQKAAEGESVTWDTDNFHARLQENYEIAKNDAQGWFAVTL